MRIELAAPQSFRQMLAEHFGRSDLPAISGITIDSRLVQPGDLFVPIVGRRVDGHDLAAAAVRSGAVAVMVEREIEPLPKAVVIPVASNVKELGALAKIWRSKYDLPLVAITGSNGKTTTKNLIVDVLARRLTVLGTDRSYNGTIGLPLTILRTGPDTELIVVELGSNQPGEIAYLADIARPQLALITNISETHLQFFHTLDGVAQEKLALFQALPADGVALVNRDDPRVAAMETVARRLTYSLSQPADVRGRYRESVQGAELSIDRLPKIRMSQPGRHLAQNILAAVAVGLEMGVAPQQIKEAIEGFSIPSGRGEVIRHDGITLIDDSYNANLASTLAGLQTLMRLPAQGRRIVVFGDMLELGPISEEHHRQVGLSAVEQGVDELFCYGPQSRAAFCAAQSAGLAVHHYTDKGELSAALGQVITAGDVVYVKGSRGMAMETIIDTVFGG